jgi:copper(I)-binding protein
MIVRTTLIAAFLSALLTNSPSAHDTKVGDILIQHAWARASIGAAKAGAAYLTLVNHGGAPDRLVSVRTPVAERAGLHSHTMEDGVMKMRPVGAIEVAPGEPTVLGPGGLHIMMMGLKAPLVEGERFPVTLVFERAGEATVHVIIDKATSMHGPLQEHSDHTMTN